MWYRFVGKYETIRSEHNVAWKRKGSKYYWIKKQIEHVRFHPSKVSSYKGLMHVYHVTLAYRYFSGQLRSIQDNLHQTLAMKLSDD